MINLIKVKISGGKGHFTVDKEVWEAIKEMRSFYMKNGRVRCYDGKRCLSLGSVIKKKLFPEMNGPIIRINRDILDYSLANLKVPKIKFTGKLRVKNKEILVCEKTFQILNGRSFRIYQEKIWEEGGRSIGQIILRALGFQHHHLIHKNGDELDFQLSNLQAFPKGYGRDILGYSFNKHSRKFVVIFRIDSKHRYFGSFETEKQAKKAAQKAMREHIPPPIDLGERDGIHPSVRTFDRANLQAKDSGDSSIGEGKSSGKRTSRGID